VRRPGLFLDDFYFLAKNTKPADRAALALEWREIVVDGDYKATRGNVFNWVAVMHTRTAGSFNQAWQDASLHNVAPLFVNVADTTSRPGVHLQALPKEAGKRMLELYLKFSRTGRAPSAVFPFTEEALTYILDSARQKGQELEGKCDPRSVLEVAQAVFVRALFDASEHAEVDLALAQHVLEGIPLPEPVKRASADAIEAADEAAVAPSERRMPLTAACACDCHVEEGTPANDLVAVVAGGQDERGPDSIIGYRCLGCNAPVRPPGSHVHTCDRTTASSGKLIFHIFGALAEFERDLIRGRSIPL
jgi:hypothetical protein